jgi:hypothetical protein
MLTRMLDLPEASGEDVFPDAAGKWYESDVKACAEAGYIRGYEDGTFRGANVINYGELANILERVTGTRPDYEDASADVSRLAAAEALIGIESEPEALPDAA